MAESIFQKLKFVIWRLVYTPLYSFRYFLTSTDRERLNILNSEQTCNFIIENNCSVSRFGDGELQLICHWLNRGDSGSFCVDSFQEYDAELSKRLYKVLTCRKDNLLVCLPYPFKNASVYSGYDRLFFKREYLSRKTLLNSLSLANSIWGDTDFTRFYLHREDLFPYSEYVGMLKRIWDRRNILIVEGRYSRLGVGNDLFDNAGRIRRILCPAQNAFSRYDTILGSIKEIVSSDLVLLALGQTASVLASDLADSGIQAIDIGHIDIEYEWYLMGAKDKVPVPNKYVNEVKSGRISNEIVDTQYFKEIILDLS